MKKIISSCIVNLSFIYFAFITAYVILFSGEIYSQPLSKEWKQLSKTENSIIYLNTANIKVYGNKVAAFIQEIYDQPELNEVLSAKISRIKTFYYFYLPKNRYTTVGTIYYDTNGTMIGESGNQMQSSIENLFQSEIESDTKINEIYKSVLTYLDDNKVQYSKLETPEDQLTPQSQIELADQNTESYADDSLNENENKTVNNLNNTKSTGKYESSKEKKIRGNIYSDGSLYIIQISSWNQKAKAESEVAKLKKRGHDAFYTEVNLPEKGGNWYRVRVGYFSSLSEAEKYSRANNLNE